MRVHLALGCAAKRSAGSGELAESYKQIGDSRVLWLLNDSQTLTINLSPRADPTAPRAMGVASRIRRCHAALAWQIAAWAEPQLDDASRAATSLAREQALGALLRSLETEPDPELAQTVGLPTPATARAMLTALAAELGLSAAA